MKYKIKTDWWIKLILWACILMFVPMMFFSSEEDQVILVISTIVMAVLILPLFMAYYELEDEELVTHIYFFKLRIKYDDVKSLTLCKNWLSSGTAMSYERIKIVRHGKGKLTRTTYISPVNREDCYSDLKNRCRNLEMKDSTIFEEMDVLSKQGY